MGLSPELKAFLKKTYPSAFKTLFSNQSTANNSHESQSSKHGSNNHIPTSNNSNFKSNDEFYMDSPYQPNLQGKYVYKYPKNVQVCISDHTRKLKSYNDFQIKNGHDFVMKHVLTEAQTFLTMPNAKEFYICFDRGSPITKNKEHDKRYGKLIFQDIKTIPDDKVLISDEVIPNSKEWRSFSNHPYLKQELIYYVTQKILVPHESGSKLYTYTPPRNKKLFLFGGSLEKPVERSKRTPQYKIKPDLYCVTNEPIVEGGRDLRTYEIVNPDRNQDKTDGGEVGDNSFYSSNKLKNLLEGESSVQYFAKIQCLNNMNVMLITNDGDLLIQSLLSCKDRIDKTTGKFKNNLYVRLVPVFENECNCEDVDVNLLYNLIIEDKIYKNNGITHPELLIAAVSCLLKNDYFDGFGHGLGKISPGKDEECPTLLYTMLKYIKDFGNTMIVPVIQSDNDEDCLSGGVNKSDLLSSQFPITRITIDEDLFILYTQLCYVDKYKGKALSFLSRKNINSSSEKEKNNDDNDDDDDDDDDDSTDDESKPGFLKLKQKFIKDIEMVREYLATNKTNDPPSERSLKNRMLETRKCRIYSRMLEWTLEYFINSYRGNCGPLNSPLETFGGYSYYGWVKQHFQLQEINSFLDYSSSSSSSSLLVSDYNDETNDTNTKIVMADKVSKKRPSTRYLWKLQDKNKSGAEVTITKTITTQEINNNNNNNTNNNITLNDKEQVEDITTTTTTLTDDDDYNVETTIYNNVNNLQRTTGSKRKREDDSNAITSTLDIHFKELSSQRRDSATSKPPKRKKQKVSSDHMDVVEDVLNKSRIDNNQDLLNPKKKKKNKVIKKVNIQTFKVNLESVIKAKPGLTVKGKRKHLSTFNI